MTGPEPGSDQRTASIDHRPENLRLLPWPQADAELLRDTLAHTSAGLESESEFLVRHDRYLRGWADGDAFFYVVELDGVSVGSIGYWYGSSRGMLAYEAAWSIVPHARGVTAASVRMLLEEAAAYPVPRFVHAFVAQSDLDASATCIEAGFDRVDLVEQGEPPELYVDWAFDLAAVA